MSLNAIMGNALSGLNASQAGMRATSNNTANINTPGYARQEVNLAARSVAGVGAGVDIESVRRVTDRFLTSASYQAGADAAGQEAAYDILDRAQAAFGDPASENALFGIMNDTFARFASLSGDPSSAVRRSEALADLDTTLREFARVGDALQDLRGEADTRIGGLVDEANALLQDISRLNTEVQRGSISGNATGAADALSQSLDALSKIMDIRTSPRDGGAVEVRTGDGILLVGQTTASLSYASAGVASPGTQYNSIMIAMDGEPGRALEPHLSAGELEGLVRVRDTELPAMAAQLGEFAAGFAESLNAAHNEAVAFPPPTTLTGRNTGLLGTDTAAFTGVADVVLLSSDGAWKNRLTIDFDAGVITDPNTGTSTAIADNSVQGLTTALDTALAPFGGSASFSNGALRLTGGADASGTNGLAVVQSQTAPSDLAGKGFSHFFGLNDLVESSGPLSFASGVDLADAHGLPAGQDLTLRVMGADGKLLRQVSAVSVAGGSFNDLLGVFNNPATGFGAFGALNPDPAQPGAVAFQPAAGFEGARIEVVRDTTTRGSTDVAVSTLFGLGDGARAGRAMSLDIRSDVAADPQRLALGALDFTGLTRGDVITGVGDGAGAQRLQAAGDAAFSFSAAGDMAAVRTSLVDYGGRIAGDAGRRAASAERAQNAAVALRDEADARRAGVEGVNIDEELVKLTMFQQSYNASSRLIQAAKEMTDTLLSIV